MLVMRDCASATGMPVRYISRPSETTLGTVPRPPATRIEFEFANGDWRLLHWYAKQNGGHSLVLSDITGLHETLETGLVPVGPG